jgi:hypothetical protein
MRNKRPIPEFLLKDKREGAYFTGLPLIGVTPESGVVYGGSVQWYDNGSKENPFFSYAPYRKKINATLAFGTKGRQEYILEYDRPTSPTRPGGCAPPRRISCMSSRTTSASARRRSAG